MAHFSHVSEPDFAVDINTEYGVTANAEELTTLTTARQLGDLSHENYMNELKRRCVLRNDFSVADNRDRLATELM